jgi:hypothetical protein
VAVLLVRFDELELALARESVHPSAPSCA